MEPDADVVDEVSVTLPVAVATPLAYALVDRIATVHGVRVLAIKGPLLEKLGLRTHKISTDADILVEPAKMSEFCEILARHGWNDRDVRFSPSILEPHSRTLIHEKWPSDIDVHSYFPGFFGPAGEVFDLLWETRTQVELANVRVNTASREANAVIALLHLHRNSPNVEEHRQHDEIMTALRADKVPAQAAALSLLADVGRFRSILERELRELGVGGTFDDLTPQEQSRWEINRQTSSEATTGSWLYAITVAGWKSKIKVFFRAIYPSNDELRKDPGMAESDSSRLVAARVRRLARGIRTLPSAALSILKNMGTK
ncbi:nucleotidyltransferase family protein [Arthrobacter sp. StoSoilB20]|uniref:nucleotidyltransferase family protein n=1 Tax=Arthrobacter sp. StoSoilB20 TaxID=2830995 RepID=UPI001CC73F17|nr:nucleotidyltransferase family protein [Arthrobacter sp. StoSoilB20]